MLRVLAQRREQRRVERAAPGGVGLPRAAVLLGPRRDRVLGGPHEQVRLGSGRGLHGPGEHRGGRPGKPGREQEFLDAHARVERNWPGLRHANMIQTGERTYCIIGEWDDMDAMAAARPHMIATLDSFRDTLDGDTDPVSGPVVMALK